MRSPLLRLLAFGAAFVAVGAAQTMLHQLWAPLGLVDGMMIAVGLIALRASFAGAVWAGAIGGLIQDSLAGGIVGLHAFAKTVAAAAMAVVGDFLAIRGQLAEAMIIAAAAALEATITRLLLLFLGWPASDGPLIILLRAGATGIVCGILTVGVPLLISNYQAWRRRPRLRW